MRPLRFGLFIFIICSFRSEGAGCADPKLSQLDQDTLAAYQAATAELSPAGAANMEQDQREWLPWLRQICRTNEYTEQLHLLQHGIQRVGGITFFPRVKVLIAPDKEKPQPGSTDPGFGLGWFSWPEIDQPTPQQAPWNAAVRAKVVGMSAQVLDGRTPPKDFEAASVFESEVSVSYTFKAVNERFISMDLENSAYNYGAAHPNEYTVSFEWWVELQRALEAGDVFRPDSGWETFLGQRCYQKLISGEHADSLYDNRSGVQRATMDSAKQVSGWTVDARGLRVAFSEYSVAPRAVGWISVELSWEELKPYLASGFDPAMLPQPMKPDVR